MSARRDARETVAALGAGRMGRGIATAFAYAGHEVLLAPDAETARRPFFCFGTVIG